MLRQIGQMKPLRPRAQEHDNEHGNQADADERDDVRRCPQFRRGLRGGFYLQLMHGLFAFHFVKQRIGDSGLNDVSGLSIVDIGYAINLGGLAHRTAEQLTVFFPAFDKHV